MVSPAALALFATAACLLLTGIILAALAHSVARDASANLQTNLIATRSRYVLGKVAGASACASGADGCDGSCDPIDLTSSVPTYAYFKFYDITNRDDVNTIGATPDLQERGPFTCVTAPPYAEARLTRTSATSSDDSTATQMTYTELLECPHVLDGGQTVNLYNKATDSVESRTAAEWVGLLKIAMVSGGDTVGTGGAPDFESYSAHGNVSIPNNYMRRAADDVPVLPVFPHAYLPDGEYYLTPTITDATTLQWHITSIGQTVSFTWAHQLYYTDPSLNRAVFARFVGYLPAAAIDLSVRGSDLFDKAYSYHKCTGITGTNFATTTNYPLCATGTGMLSPDDFILDVDLFMGVPAPAMFSVGYFAGFTILNGVSGWQAWTVPEFASLGNCTAKYGDANVAPLMWGWGFWGEGLPYVSHEETGGSPFGATRTNINAHGYNPFGSASNVDFSAALAQSKWLAEFGVTRAGGVLPAFAFSMMPKMYSLISPTGVGSSYPLYLMGVSRSVLSDYMVKYGVDTSGLEKSSFMLLFGAGVPFTFLFFAHGLYTVNLYSGIYCIVFAICPVAVYGAYRVKADAKLG